MTDTILDLHTECIVFKDLGVGTMGKIERRLFLTAWSRRDRVWFCDNEKGGHWAYDADGHATVRVIYAYCVMLCFGLF